VRLAQRDTAPPATSDFIDSLNRGVCTDADARDPGMACSVCQHAHADWDGSFAEGMEFMEMPCGHRFHVGCLTVCLKTHATCPHCYEEKLKKAYRQQSRKYKAGRGYGAEGTDEAEMATQVTAAYDTLKDPRKRQEYDLTGGIDKAERPPPCTSHIISRELYKSGGVAHVPFSADGVVIPVKIPPNVPRPYEATLPAESGMPFGTKVLIEVESRDASLQRKLLHLNLEPALCQTSGLAGPELRQAIDAKRKLVDACDEMARQVQLDIEARQKDKVLKVLDIDKRMVRNLEEDAVLLAERGAELLHICEISQAESLALEPNIVRAVELPDEVYELSHPGPVESGAVLVSLHLLFLPASPKLVR